MVLQLLAEQLQPGNARPQKRMSLWPYSLDWDGSEYQNASAALMLHAKS